MINIPPHQRDIVDNRFTDMYLGELHPDSPGDEFFNASRPKGGVAASQLGLYALTDRNDIVISDWTAAYSVAEKKFFKQLGGHLRFLADYGWRAHVVTMHQIHALGLMPDQITSDELIDFIVHAERVDSIREINTYAANELAGYLDEQSRAKLSKRMGRVVPEPEEVSGWQKYLSGDEILSTKKKEVPVLDHDVEEAKSTGKIAEYNQQIYMRGETDFARKVSLGAFSAWLASYKVADRWQAAGFDYVPVEPILDFKFNPKRGNVFVRSVRINGDAAGRVLPELGLTKKRDAADKMERVAKVLVDLGVGHSHLHPYNFIIDTTHHNRVYVIDFTLARIMRPIKH